jgi:WD40 repeat protein
MWDSITGEYRGLVLSTQTEINDVDISPDGNTFVGAGEDGSIRIWSIYKDISTNAPFHGCKTNGSGIAYSPSGDRLAISCILPDSDHEIVIFNPETLEVLDLIEDYSHYISKPLSLYFQNDQTLITPWELREEIKFYDLKNRQFKTGFIIDTSNITYLRTALSTDRNRFASSVRYGGALLWDLSQPEEGPITIGDGDVRFVNALEFNPEGTMLVTGGWERDKIIRFWDVETGNHGQC